MMAGCSGTVPHRPNYVSGEVKSVVQSSFYNSTRKRLAPIRAAARRRRLLLRRRSSLSPMDAWTRAGGNRLRTEELDLTPGDVVLDFGGYRGEYAETLIARYGCTVHVFEPVPEFADYIRSRSSDERLRIHQVAIGPERTKQTLYLGEDATGIGISGEQVEIDVESPAYLTERGIVGARLAKINIEGGEYSMLPALDDSGLLENIERIFVQFHSIDAGSEADRARCRALLRKHHDCDWEYSFVWESWTKRKD